MLDACRADTDGGSAERGAASAGEAVAGPEVTTSDAVSNATSRAKDERRLQTATIPPVYKSTALQGS